MVFVIQSSTSLTVGSTPIVEVKSLNPNPSVTVLAKLEGFNPTGSHKDRVAKEMIEDAETKGKLTRGKTILEATSGNTGIALARIASKKGYKAKFVMPESVSKERRKIMKAFGAEIVLTESSLGEDGAIAKARELAENSPGKYWYSDQFTNPSNWKAHYGTTGPEIWKQTQGKVTHFVMGMGTGGSITGVGRYLKERNRDIKVIGIKIERGSEIQGLKRFDGGIVPEIYQEDVVDRKVEVAEREANHWSRKITREEGLFVGQSSGANFAAVRKVARDLDDGTVTTLFGDFGFKYLSSGPYTEGDKGSKKQGKYLKFKNK